MGSTTHTIRSDRRHLHAHFERGAAPALTIESGDTVRFLDVPDVSWGLEPPTSTTAPRRKVEPRDPARDNGPCMLGPVAVRGADPGDVLEIAIEEVRTGAWGWTYAAGRTGNAAVNAACGLAAAPLALLRWDFDRDRGVATNHLGHSVRMRPFPGTIGMAPDEERASGWVPRACGGNMDCRELVAGSTLFLPVCVPGGLLSLGDGHAAQGDGELSGTAIECMFAEIRVRVAVRKCAPLSGPRVRTADGTWATLGFGESLDEAAASATASMIELMHHEMKIERAEALALASSRVSLRITQLVNPKKGVHAVLSPDEALR